MQRRPGITSRMRPAPGRKHMWRISPGHMFRLPVIVDHVSVDPATGEVDWCIEAMIDLVDGEPALVRMDARAASRAGRLVRAARPLPVARRRWRQGRQRKGHPVLRRILTWRQGDRVREQAREPAREGDTHHGRYRASRGHQPGQAADLRAPRSPCRSTSCRSGSRTSPERPSISGPSTGGRTSSRRSHASRTPPPSRCCAGTFASWASPR